MTSFSSIKFPIVPERIDNFQETIFTATDSEGVYIVSLRKMPGSANNLSKEELPEFYKGVSEGAINATNGKLINKKDININGCKGIEINYVSNSNPQLPSARFKQIIFVNEYLISCDFWAFDEQKEQTKETKEKFFNSLSIIIDNETEKEISNQKGSYDKEYNIGYQIGKIIGLLVFLGVAIGIIFLIRFLIKKNKK